MIRWLLVLAFLIAVIVATKIVLATLLVCWLVACLMALQVFLMPDKAIKLALGEDDSQ
jgi:hypothetical protein